MSRDHGRKVEGMSQARMLSGGEVGSRNAGGSSNPKPSWGEEARPAAKALIKALQDYEQSVVEEEDYIHPLDWNSDLRPAHQNLARLYYLGKLPGKGHSYWIRLERASQEAIHGLPPGLPEHKENSWWLRKRAHLFIAVSNLQRWLS